MNNAVPTISIRSSDAFSPAPASQCAQPSPMVGNTPVLWIGEPFADNGRGFWAKLEGANPGGMKDRPALHWFNKPKPAAISHPARESLNPLAAHSV